MPVGPGKYDDLCTYVREQADADAALVIVLGGKHGEGFSVQTFVPTLSPKRIADILRNIASQIDGAAP